MSIDQSIQQYAEGFFDEAADLLANAEQLLLALDPAAPEPEDVNAIFRCAHSIKGGAGTFGFTALMETTHLLESHLDRARNGQLAWTPEIVNVFLQTKDNLQEQVRAYRADEEPDAQAVAAICDALRNLPVDEPSIASAAVQAATARHLSVVLTGVSEGDRDSLRAELELMAEGGCVSAACGEDKATITLWTTCMPDDIVGVCCFVVNEDQVTVTVLDEGQPAPLPRCEPQQQAAIKKGAPAKPARDAKDAGKDGASIRVDVAKVDKIMNQVGELVITQAMLTEAASKLDPILYERIYTSIGHLARNALDLQESVMQIRMLPMEHVFSRYPRVIRDTSAKLGKQVRLETYGQQTELDKGLIERIVDPLTHLVRNSLDHGIESPAQRAAAGKDPTGTLLLSAQHRGGNIVIEVSDDGAGLNRERILAKAHEKGLPSSEGMSDDELWQLIFMPGFSTAEQVTEISGRGVGMDVVRRNIQEMGGHVEISSRPGRGTTTRIVLPLTLAILDGMSVRVGREIYVLPLNYVLESLRPDVENLHSLTGTRRVVKVRGEYLPLIALHQAFLVPGARTDPSEGILVIVQMGEARMALQVDELLGQHQVVVKNLETNYRRVPGISAATIMGDGSVALIVDVAAMHRLQGAYAASEQVLAAAARREIATS